MVENKDKKGGKEILLTNFQCLLRVVGVGKVKGREWRGKVRAVMLIVASRGVGEGWGGQPPERRSIDPSMPQVAHRGTTLARC